MRTTYSTGDQLNEEEVDRWLIPWREVAIYHLEHSKLKLRDTVSRPYALSLARQHRAYVADAIGRGLNFYVKLGNGWYLHTRFFQTKLSATPPTIKD